MPQTELSPSPVAWDPGSDEFLGVFYRVDVETLVEWADITNFMMGSLRISVKQPEVTSNFCDFIIIMIGNDWEKRILRYTTILIEKLTALIPGFCKLTTYQKTQWAERFDSWPPSTLRVQLKELAESGGFLEIE